MSHCSECGKPIKPVVSVDIDGTLTEYHRTLAEFAWRYFNMDWIWGVGWDGIGNFEDYIGLTQDQYREAKLAFRQGGFKRWATLQPDAYGLITQMGLWRTWGVEVWVSTTRPWMRHDSTDPDTRHWLERFQVPYDHLLYDDDKYDRLAAIVGRERVVAVVDDLPEQVDAAHRNFGPAAFMVERRHNIHSGWRELSSGSLGEFIDHVNQRIKEWTTHSAHAS